jgi:antitoxin (DNA-binding transcriptional repressor) of toxin-antitoxin stability system
MVKVDIKDAKHDLSNLIERALQGKDVFITHNDTTLVNLVPVEQKKLRPMGLHRKKLSQEEIEESLEPTCIL